MTSIYLSSCSQVQNCMCLKIINILFFICDVPAHLLANAGRKIYIPFYCVSKSEVFDETSVLKSAYLYAELVKSNNLKCLEKYVLYLSSKYFSLFTFQSNHWCTLRMDFFLHVHYWPNFASTGNFITYCSGNRVGPLLSASANSRLRRHTVWKHSRELRSPWLAAEGPN